MWYSMKLSIRQSFRLFVWRPGRTEEAKQAESMDAGEAPFPAKLASGEQSVSKSTVVEEGWADKESRHFGSWRRRWLVLFREESTQLPYMCTFKRPKNGLAASGGLVRPTERLLIVGATCMVVASRGPGRDHVFWLRTRKHSIPPQPSIDSMRFFNTDAH